MAKNVKALNAHLFLIALKVVGGLTLVALAEPLQEQEGPVADERLSSRPSLEIKGLWEVGRNY